jgi:hypothetical protein
MGIVSMEQDVREIGFRLTLINSIPQSCGQFAERRLAGVSLRLSPMLRGRPIGIWFCINFSRQPLPII